MAKGIEVAQAFVTIIPSLKGSQDTIAKELGAEKIGEDSGKKISAGIGSALGKAGKVIAKGFAVGTTAAVAGISAITVAATNAYSEYEQLAGGAQQIFSGMSFDTISADAQSAYKTMGMSANEYLESINQTGAAFKATMGDEVGYNTAKRGMQAIADYASGTGRSVDELNEKYAMITRSTSSYQSIADQFSGILPATSADFLEQAQNAGLLSTEYKKLTDVPISEYQQAVTAMLEGGVDALGLTGNTAREAEHTISGSLSMLRSSWTNFLTELGKDDADIEARVSELVDAAMAVARNIIPRAMQIVGKLGSEVVSALIEQGPTIAQGVTDLLDEVTGGAFSKMVEAVAPYVEQIGTTAQSLIERFRPLAPVVQDIGSKLGGIFLTSTRAVSNAFSFIAPIIATVAEHALPALDTVLGGVSTALSALMGFLEPVGTFLGETLVGAVDYLGQGVEQLAEDIDKAFGWIADKLGAAAEFMSDPIGGMSKMADKLGKSFMGTADNAEKSTAKVSKKYEQLDKNISKSMGNAAKSTKTSMSSLSSSVSTQTSNAAKSAETNSKRIESSWNKSYNTNLTATANTSKAESDMSSFKSRWTGFGVSGSASVSTKSANDTLNNFMSVWNGRVINMAVNVASSALSKIGLATGGVIVQKHADGFIANRPGRGVNITQHIVGESGAEAVIPLTNRRYVAPFARTVADYVNGATYNIYIDDARVNDDEEIQAAMLNLFGVLIRRGAMNVGNH